MDKSKQTIIVADEHIIKTLLTINVKSLIADSDNPEIGEASTGFEFTMNGGFPELAFAIAQLLQVADEDPDIKAIARIDNKPVGDSFITLLTNYYKDKRK